MVDRPFRIEPDGSHDSGLCPCCGEVSRSVWGYLFANERPAAAYFVYWTRNGVAEHGANFDLVLGDWGEGATPNDRYVVAVAYRLIDGRPQFMVIDAAGRPVTEAGTLAATGLRREDVVGTPLARDIFDVLDAILLGDGRIGELAGRE